ncbi:MAG TPA: SGNH/GDSL hydrolase family protein [Micromonosporaceae bacterium]|nr:SGNH/GDSL hydrolase family protein [Micromonosporaceae bacterium]
MRWRSFAALGDSFTEGLDDPYPDGTAYRGWADIVAGRLAAEVPEFRYANLAVRGRLLSHVIDEQVPQVLAMRPELVSFAAGGNDALRRGFDADALIARFDRAIATIRESGADVILFRFSDFSRRLPGGRRILLPRVQRLNAAADDVARRHGAYLVDLWSDEAFYNPRMWSVDRLHFSSAAHQRVAAHVLATLGFESDPAWLSAPPPPDAASWAARRAADAVWARQHLAPWVRRRLAGRSSGDLQLAKRPTLAPPP